MNDFLYGVGSFLLIGSITLFVTGFAKPKLYQKLFGSKSDRKHIAIYSIGIFIAAATMATIFEPASVTQARLDKESQARIAEQQRVEEEHDKQEEVEQQEEIVAEQPVEEDHSDNFYSVVRVVDGDTIVVNIDGVDEYVRLVGVDTPEVIGSSPQCYAAEASNGVKAMLLGLKVKLEIDEQQGDRDRYGRLLRFVFLNDGTHVNEKILSKGLGFEKLYTSQPHKYHSDFVKSEQAAKNAKRGLWSSSTCNGKYEKAKPKTQSNQSSAIAPVAPKPKPKAKPKPAPSPRSAYYKNCTAARAAGAAPIYRGQPGYGTHLDRDKDGIACE